MVRITRGRIVRREELGAGAAALGAGHERTLRSGAPGGRRGRVVPAEIADAHERAHAIVAAAEARAEEVVEARVAAALLATKVDDERRAERDQQRVIQTAVVLAERLVGAALVLDAERIVPMAQAAIREARGARSFVIEANPLDAGPLRAQLDALGLPDGSVSVEERAELARGDLVLKTNLGTVDARLKPQLERLKSALSRLGHGQ